MVAVTGATGHLGTVLVQRLVTAGETVRWLARGGSVAHGLQGLPDASSRSAGATRVDVDLFDAAALERAFAGARVVYHAAARIAFWSGEDDELYRVNVEGSRAVVRAARAAGVRRFVHVGSIEAFPLEYANGPVSESDGIDPERTVMAYGRTKAIGMLEALDSAGGTMEVVVCCPTAFIGPPDYRRSPLGSFVLDYLHRRLPAYVDGGFDFTDVRDVAEGIIRAADRGHDRRVYLLGGRYATLPELVGMLEEISGVAPPPLRLPIGLLLPLTGLIALGYRLTGRAPRFTAESLSLLSLGVRVDCSRAKEELGYRSRPLRETLADTVRWFVEEGLAGPLPNARR